jgi:EthD domain-containing protein
METSTMAVALLQRNPAMTPQQFSHHWFTQHAPLVVPMLLHSGIAHYEQARDIPFLPLSALSNSAIAKPLTYPLPSRTSLPSPPLALLGPRALLLLSYMSKAEKIIGLCP